MSPIELSWTAKKSDKKFSLDILTKLQLLYQTVVNTFLIHIDKFSVGISAYQTLVAGAWTERKKMYHGGSFLKLADDNMDIQNPEAQNRELSGF